MKSISILSLLLPLSLLLSLSTAKLENLAPATAPAASPTNLILKACENSSKKGLCFSVLNSDPTAKTATLKGLAFVALKAAAKTAASTSAHIKSLVEKGSVDEPELEDGLTTCAQSYVDVVDQIEDSVDALVAEKYKNVNTWGKAAIADVATCNGSVKGQSAPTAKEIVAKNVVVHDLCKNALEVVHVWAHNSNHQM